MVDMYIDGSEPTENVGQIHFSLEYDFQNTTLILKVIQVSPRNAIIDQSPKRKMLVKCLYSAARDDERFPFVKLVIGNIPFLEI